MEEAVTGCLQEMAGQRKPVIGIAGLTRETESGMFRSMERAFTGSTNVRAIMKNGGIPLILPAAVLAEDPAAALACCDGLLLPGGEDMTPWYYGEEPLPVIGAFRPEIDEAWIRAVNCALEHRKPILGICKGAQTINVALGGSLYQDLSLQAKETGKSVLQHLQKYDRTYVTHHVEVYEGTRLATLFPAGPLKTNSMHHQAVKKLAEGLTVSARAADGTIEAFEDESGLIMATQWHPEDLVDSAPVMNRLFSDLIARAVRFGCAASEAQ